MKYFNLIIVILCFYSCEDVELSENNITKKLDALTNSEIVDIAGISLSVVENNSEKSTFSGYSDKNRTSKIYKDQPFRVASITKTFVAATIFRLQEEGLLSINDPVSKFISQKHIDILKLGGYNPDQILIKQCLNHTSGLFDYAVGQTGNGSSPYINIATNNPNKVWTRTEQIEGAMTWGKPYGNPGEVYSYSDTGYLILGEIIENLTNKNIGIAIRDVLDFKKMNLKHTWYEKYEDYQTKDVISRYFYNIDFTHFDASIDLYGGGGIISTTKDLATFYHFLFKGDIFNNKETLTLFISEVNTSKSSKDYRNGFEVLNIYGQDAYYHSGIWNTQVIYLPNLDTAIAINFTEKKSDYLLKNIIYSLTNQAKK